MKHAASLCRINKQWKQQFARYFLGPVVQKTIRLNLNRWKITEQNSEHPLMNIGILFRLTWYELINILFCEAWKDTVPKKVWNQNNILTFNPGLALIDLWTTQPSAFTECIYPNLAFIVFVFVIDIFIHLKFS